MKKLISVFCLLSVIPVFSACTKTEQVSKSKQNNSVAKADILLNDDGNISDQQLDQAQHVNIEVKGNGIVVITGVKSPSGEVKNHELDPKASKELLHEIVKASKGGDKQKLSGLISDHVTRLQQIK